MQPQLAAIVTQLEQAQEQLNRLVAKIPTDRWNVRARADEWSVAENVAHLNLTSKAYIPLLTKALVAPSATSRSPGRRYRQDFIGWILARSLGPLPRVGGFRLGRMKTAAAFVPGGDLDQPTTVAEFNSFQAQLIEITRAADGKALDQVRIVSPFDARIRYSAYSGLVILPRHQRRHLDQADRVWNI